LVLITQDITMRGSKKRKNCLLNYYDQLSVIIYSL